MGKNEVLLVLAVREAAYRSALSAKLMMAGADILTVGDVDDTTLARRIHRPAVLIIQQAVIDDRTPEWLRVLLDAPHWHCVVVLCPDMPLSGAGGGDPRLIYLAEREAVATLIGLIPQWRDETAAS